MNQLILDIASAPLPDAASYLEEPRPPANYKDPEKIAAYIEQRRAELLASAALDLDLARITAVGLAYPDGGVSVLTCKDEISEAAVLRSFAADLANGPYPSLITFAGRRFDLPLLQRRSMYLGVAFPKLDLDRYRSPHRDLCELLAGGERDRMRSLDFYVKRLGWTDLLPKPMDGAEEAKVFEHGEWNRLAASTRRDVEAVRRLAVWMGELDEDPIIP